MTNFSSSDGQFRQWISDFLTDSNFWLWFKDGVYNGNYPAREGNFSAPINLEEDNMVNQSLGMVVYPNGELHLLVNETDIGMPWSNLPTDQPLYGVVGLENDNIRTAQLLLKG